MRVGRRQSERATGFSLLELLAVMAIMALLSTLAVTSYFGAVRGMSLRSAKRHFESALVQARQRACIDGTRVSLMAYNEIVSYDDQGKDIEDMAACYVVCKEIGRISYVSGNYLFDEFADLGQLFNVGDSRSTGNVMTEGGIRLYNLSRGTWTLVRPFVSTQEVGSAVQLLYTGRSHRFKAYAFQKQQGTGVQSSGSGSGTWEVGDSYGIEVSPVQFLPKGFLFSGLLDSESSLTDVKYVTFESDGTRRTAGSSGNDGQFTIKAPPAAGGGEFVFTIAPDGKITYP